MRFEIGYGRDSSRNPFTILECDDGWYVLQEHRIKMENFGHKHWKCDQFEGLVKIMKDKGII